MILSNKSPSKSDDLIWTVKEGIVEDLSMFLRIIIQIYFLSSSSLMKAILEDWKKNWNVICYILFEMKKKFFNIK